MDETYSPGSVLGRFAEIYSDEEKKLCQRIATFLKSRWDGPRPTRDDMDFYVRAAASIYELAKQLHSLAPLSRKATPKTAEEWVQIITGNRFHYYTDPNLVKNALDLHVSTEKAEPEVRVGLPSPFALTAKEIESGQRPSEAAPESDCIDVTAASPGGAKSEAAKERQPPPDASGGPTDPSGAG